MVVRAVPVVSCAFNVAGALYVSSLVHWMPSGPKSLTKRSVSDSAIRKSPLTNVPLSTVSIGLLHAPMCGLLGLQVLTDDSRHAFVGLPSGSTRVSSHSGSCGKPPLDPGGVLVSWSTRTVKFTFGSPPLQSTLPAPS